MLNPFEPGQTKTFSKTVATNEVAAFDSGTVHPVYATFAIAKDAEWSGRLFVLEMKEADEEGIGTFVSVEHKAPVLVGQEVIFTATLESINGNEIITTYEAKCGDRLVAKGRQGQKILKKEKLEKLFNSLV